MHTTLWPTIFVVLLFVVAIQLIAKKFNAARITGGIAVPFLILGLVFPAPEMTQQSQPSAVAAATEEPVAEPTDAPQTEAPDDTSFPSKSQMLGEVNADVTPEKFAGNPSKYKGDVVRFNCKITNVLAGDDQGYHEANAECGSGNTTDYTASDYHVPATIVLVGKTVGQMDAGQEVRVLGIAGPMDGKNLMGADAAFASVAVAYAE